MKLSRLLLIFSLILFGLFSFPSKVLAEFEGVSAGVSKWATTAERFQKIRDESEGFSLEKLISATILDSLYVWNEAVSGKVKEGKQLDPKNPAINENSGAIGIVGNYIAQMVAQPPTSSVEYIADIGHQINPVKPAYAQGTGYQGLHGVLEIWKGFRNIAYALFVIIFVVVGFMIMFRTKLNPQTVVSLQLALPKLIITLLLITFSYAIAGFIIDLIYFIIYLAVSIFNTIPGMHRYDSGADFLAEPFTDTLKLFSPDSIAKNFGDSLVNLFPDTGTVGETLKEVLGVSLIRVIVAGAILFSILKLLFQLIIAYVNIIIQVIFSPIILLFNALPQSNSFSSWIKNLVANAAAFPATAIMILVGSALSSNPNAEDNFTPPFLGTLTNITPFAQNVIGLGTILLLPKIVSMIQEALKAKSALPVGAAIAEGAAIGTAPIRSYLSARKERKRMEQQAELYKQAQN